MLEQALRALGYDDVAAALEAASGVVQQAPVAAAFRSAVLAGQYDAALRLLPAVAADERVVDRARFLLLRAKYVELMEAGASAAALQVGGGATCCSACCCNLLSARAGCCPCWGSGSSRERARLLV